MSDPDNVRQERGRKELRPSFCRGTRGLVSKGSPPSSSLGLQPKNTMRAEMREQVPGHGWRSVAGEITCRQAR